jgi:hypothetical protein
MPEKSISEYAGKISSALPYFNAMFTKLGIRGVSVTVNLSKNRVNHSLMLELEIRAFDRVMIKVGKKLEDGMTKFIDSDLEKWLRGTVFRMFNNAFKKDYELFKTGLTSKQFRYVRELVRQTELMCIKGNVVKYYKDGKFEITPSSHSFVNNIFGKAA